MISKKKEFVRLNLYQLVDGMNSNLANRVLEGFKTSIKYKTLEGSDSITINELMMILREVSKVQEQEIDKYTGIE